MAGILHFSGAREVYVALVLAEYGEAVLSRGFRARACALPTTKGLWQGWIEFNPTNGEPSFRSPAETVQPSRTLVTDWAVSLTPDHLASALDRALARLGYPTRLISPSSR